MKQTNGLQAWLALGLFFVMGTICAEAASYDISSAATHSHYVEYSHGGSKDNIYNIKVPSGQVAFIKFVRDNYQDQNADRSTWKFRMYVNGVIRSMTGLTDNLYYTTFTSSGTIRFDTEIGPSYEKVPIYGQNSLGPYIIGYQTVYYKQYYVRQYYTLEVTYESSASKCLVSFDTGSSAPPCAARLYALGSTYGSFPEVSLNGQVLEGWYADPTFKTRIRETDTVSSSVTTLYAKWVSASSLGPVTLAALEISGPPSVFPGHQAVYTCEAEFSNGTKKEVNPVWGFASGSAYGTIDQDGSFIPNSSGQNKKVMISATYGGKTVGKTVSILENSIAMLIVDGPSYVRPGSKTTFTCNAMYSDDSKGPVAPVKWSIFSGSAYGSISTNGVFTAASNISVDKGEVRVRATYHDAKYGDIISQVIVYVVKSYYSIAYDYSGGTAGEDNPSSGFFSQACLVSPPSRRGYSFSGWTVSGNLNTSGAKWGTSRSAVTNPVLANTLCRNNNSGNVYFSNLASGVGKSVTLTAHWSSQTYLASCDLAGGDFIDSGYYFHDFKSYDRPFGVPVPRKTGYTFAGWKLNWWYSDISRWGTTENPTNQIDGLCFNGTTGTVYFVNLREDSSASSVRITACWETNLYSVFYDYDGGPTITQETYVASFDTPFSVVPPTRPGHVFAGWTVSEGLAPSTARWGVSSLPQTAIEGTQTVCSNGTAGTVWFLNLTPAINGNVTLKANWKAVKPSAPTNIRATTNLTDAIEVSWSGGEGATSFNVWRGTSNSRTNALRIQTGAISPFMDSSPDLVAGTPYYYWIESTNAAGSAFSSSALGTMRFSLEKLWSYTVSNGKATVTAGPTNKDVVLPDTLGGFPVTGIDGGMFAGATGLTSVSIHPGISDIGSWAFNNCTSLTAVHIQDLAAWCGISFGIGPGNPLKYAHRLYLNGKEVVRLVVPDGVAALKFGTFYGATGLKSAVLPGSLKTIGMSAFCHCSGLTNVTMPDGLSTIGEYAFAYCSGLASLTIPPTVTRIGYNAFQDCSALTSLRLPDSVTSLGKDAFTGCSCLRTLFVPASWKDTDKLDLADVPEGCIVIYGDARQEVSFVPNGGTCAVETNTYAIGGVYANLPEVSRPGWLFGGWWTASSGGIRVTETSMVTSEEPLVLYARWERDPAACRLSSCLMDNTSGLCSVHVTVKKGKTYRLQRAPDLSGPWNTVQTFTPVADGEITMEAAIPGKWSRGFYRIEVVE